MPDNNETIELTEDGVVTVDVADDQNLPEPETQKVVEVKPKAAPKPSAADEAAAALTQAVKTAEDARKAADTRAKAAEDTALAERRAREDAQRVAAQKDQEARSFKEQAEGHELTIINSGIENATKDIAASQAEIERAMEAGEFAKASAAQVKLSRASAALDRFEDAKSSYESGLRRPTEGRVETPPVQQSAFEQYVSGRTPASQAWLRAHPECVPASIGGDSTKNNKMMAGHYDAISKGFQPDTPDYFRVIEENAGYRTPITPVSTAATVVQAGTESEPEQRQAPRQRQVQPSAPVSREPPAANGSQRTTRQVTLSPLQQEAAKISFPHKTQKEANALYAQNLVELEAEGKMGRTTH